MPTDLILGTAGHIDHGKTALVKALTGVDTDRLPEEKRRGITIQLGFTQLALGDFRLGIVDVPGHERFVRNMLAGATGVDLVLLVVAADDSVKPQTREHLDILRLLDLPAGVIALTKCDIAEPEWIELVEGEVRELVAGTFLADAPIVRTSAPSGMGLDALRDALGTAAAAAAKVARKLERAGPFRMAIDRSFTIAGHGTVVTGSVLSGQAQAGDSLSIEPGGMAVRLRGLQNHDRAVEQVHRGQRAALNLAGVHHDELRRGHELATPGHLIASRRMTVRLDLLPTIPRKLVHRTRVRVHLGTSELVASVVLLGSEAVAPGESSDAQLWLADSAVATWHQPFVIRSLSPVATIGGGVVLDPVADRIRRNDAARIARLEMLDRGDPLERSSAAIFLAGLRGAEFSPNDLARVSGVPDGQQVLESLTERGDIVPTRLSPTTSIHPHRDLLSEIADQVERALARAHDENPLSPAVDRSRIVQRFAHLGSPALLDALLKWMADAGRVELLGRKMALPGRRPQLSGPQQEVLGQIVDHYRRERFQPPAVAQVQKQFTVRQADVPKLIALAEAEGQLVAINDEFMLHADVEQQLRALIDERLANGEGFTVGQIREMLQTSRKCAVPICEYLDRIGVTRREGDHRYRQEPAKE